MDEQEMAEALAALLESEEGRRVLHETVGELFADVVFRGNFEVRSFADIGALTNNSGFVIEDSDAGTFHVTVVRSR